MSKQVRGGGEHHEMMMLRFTYNDICTLTNHFPQIYE